MMMKLKTSSEENKLIELKEDYDNVYVKIDGEIVARFMDNGEFEFYGQDSSVRLKGHWNK